ncbi:hypothetical protein [Methylobacter sp. sgz302048]|uniref:hypothetical protein n=1 Tax=Methylobacter sp. sgz302048 TaxID=3455945 RepID=UPI003F9ED60D
MGATPASGPVTFDFSGAQQLGCAWTIVEYDDIDGENAVATTNRLAIAGATDISLVFPGTAPNPNLNTLIGAVIIGGAGKSVEPGPPAIEISDQVLSVFSGSLQVQDQAGGSGTLSWKWTGAANAAAIGLEIKAKSASVPHSLAETLARQFEPVLFFHEAERFFPSDAKRYLEATALWKSEQPADHKDSWGGKGAAFPRQPLIPKGKIAALSGEPGVFIADHQVLSRSGEFFLELASWTDATGTEQPKVDSSSKNTYPNLAGIAARYADGTGDPKLNESKFWYHAHLIENAALRELLATDRRPPDLVKVLDTLKDAALLCYYFFFPAHEESLEPGCTNVEATEYGSFGGEWGCYAVLLERDGTNLPYRPSFVGRTTRWQETAMPQTADNNDPARRVVMNVNRFADVVLEGNPPNHSHARLFVAKGTHSLYLTPGPHNTAYPSDVNVNFCGTGVDPLSPESSPESYNSPESALADLLIAILKLANAGALFGPLGLPVGIIATALEKPDVIPHQPFGAAPDNTGRPDETGQLGDSGLVIKPPSVAIAGAPNVQDWRSQQNLELDGRRYDFLVDHQTQHWWPFQLGSSDTAPPRAFALGGRWGPLVEIDPSGRRAGMTFPPFHRMFFLAFAQAKAAGKI